MSYKSDHKSVQRNSHLRVKLDGLKLNIEGVCYTVKVRAACVELSTAPEVAGCSATRELRGILCNPNVRYRIHNSTPLVRILNQTNLVHTIPTHFSGMNVARLSLGLPNGLFPFGFPSINTQQTNSVALSPRANYTD
jgi:hypothetical protein